MRIPAHNAADSDSENEAPETNDAEIIFTGFNRNGDEDDEPNYGAPKIPFRSVRRGTCIDFQEDDGNWYAAEVKKLDIQRRQIFVTFLNSGDMWDRWIPYDHRVASLNTYTYDNRGNFKVGQMIEFADGIGVWRKGKIVAISAEHNRVQVEAADLVQELSESRWVHGPRQNIRAVQRSLESVRSRKRWRVPTLTPSRPAYDPSATPPADPADDDSHKRTISEFSDRYSHYVRALQMQRLEVVPVNGDGNCLFRSVAHQVYGDEELHALVRDSCMSYMEAEAEFFSQFVEGGLDAFPQYLAAKRRLGCWGDDPEIQALCEIYDRPAEIWAYDPVLGARKLRTFHEAANSSSSAISSDRGVVDSAGATVPGRPPIKLSYYGGGHYDSLFDDAHRRALLRTAPGTVEQAAIARCGRRRVAASAVADADILDLKARSDAEATERAALDMAIQISRHEHLGWASEDLDASLLLALEASTTLSGKPSAPSSANGNASTSGNARDDDGVMKTPPSAHALTGEALSDAAADLVAVQQDLIRTVTEQSEREYIEKAILASVLTDQRAFPSSSAATIDPSSSAVSLSKAASRDEYVPAAVDAELVELDAKFTDEQLIEQAKLASIEETNRGTGGIDDDYVYGDHEVATALKLSMMSEDEILALAMEASLTDRRTAGATTASRRAPPAASTAGEKVGGGKVQQYPMSYLVPPTRKESPSKKPTTAAAAATSSLPSVMESAKAASTQAQKNELAQFGFYDMSTMDEEEELNRAIANSLKELQ